MWPCFLSDGEDVQQRRQSAHLRRRLRPQVPPAALFAGARRPGRRGAVGSRVATRRLRRSVRQQRARRSGSVPVDDRPAAARAGHQHQARLRHLLGSPAASAGRRLHHVQDEVRQSRRQPAVHPRGHEALLHHVAEPRLRRRRRQGARSVVGPALHQRQRCHQRRHRPPEPSVLQVQC